MLLHAKYDYLLSTLFVSNSLLIISKEDIFLGINIIKGNHETIVFQILISYQLKYIYLNQSIKHGLLSFESMDLDDDFVF